MPYYEELNPILYGITHERFLRNKKLCELLVYYNKDYDNSDAENLLKDTNKLFMRNVYPMPKMPDTKTEQGAYVCAYFNGGFEEDKNTGYRNVVLTIDIICSIDSWMVDNETVRIYEIMHQIDSMINNQLTDLPIINKPYLRGFQVRVYSDRFQGVQMLYNLQINSNIECNKQTIASKLRNGLVPDY